MKRYISIALCLAALAAVSCKGFLDQPVVSSVSDDNLLSSQNEMELIANFMIEKHMPDCSSVGLNGGDSYSDLCATKTHKDFYRPNVNITSKEGSWGSGNWALIRRANYIIANIERGRDNVSKDIFLHYKGLGYFWRAYGYYAKVTTFSNVPWIDHVISTDDPALYAGRDDRELIMHHVLEDLNIACDSLSTASQFVTSSRVIVNKYVALAFKARVCLYEGTYRKYHTVNPATQTAWTNEYETSEDFLKEAVKACEALISSGKFSLHKTYSELFTSEVIPTDEVIWSCQYSSSLPKYHDLTWYFNSATYGQQYSPTAVLVNHYLKTDGKPVTDHHLTLANVYTGRDTRMTQTILGPGHTYINGTKEIAKAPDMTISRTGYSWVKYNVENSVNFGKSQDPTSQPIFRYGETLLIYAEAKAELGEMTEDIWNNTIGALRKRAGVTSIYPGSASYVSDPWLQDYYNATGVSPVTVSDLLLEIRRERATEMAQEDGLRTHDLFRWHCGRVICRSWEGIWVDSTDSFKFQGVTYNFITSGSATATDIPISSSKVAGTWNLSEGDHGYLTYNNDTEWDEKYYTQPIPQSALNVNPALGQNKLWE